jgi:hypothetical protein
MTFRIFQVTTDGVASAVYEQNASPDPPAVTTVSRVGPAESTSAEWQELRERLRQQPTTKSARKSWLGR